MDLFGKKVKELQEKLRVALNEKTDAEARLIEAERVAKQAELKAETAERNYVEADDARKTAVARAEEAEAKLAELKAEEEKQRAEAEAAEKAMQIAGVDMSDGVWDKGKRTLRLPETIKIFKKSGQIFIARDLTQEIIKDETKLAYVMPGVFHTGNLKNHLVLLIKDITTAGYTMINPKTSCVVKAKFVEENFNFGDKEFIEVNKKSGNITIDYTNGGAIIVKLDEEFIKK